jgi:hypothetical protein
MTTLIRLLLRNIGRLIRLLLTKAVGGIGLALKRTREQGRNIVENYSSAEIGD